MRIDAAVGAAVTLDAGGTRDPDGHTLKYTWFFYSEAGTGIPGSARVGRRPRADRRGRDSGRRWDSFRPGRRDRASRRRACTLQNAASARVTVAPRVAGTAHIILAVEDDGTPGADVVSARDPDDQKRGTGASRSLTPTPVARNFSCASWSLTPN